MNWLNGMILRVLVILAAGVIVLGLVLLLSGCGVQPGTLREAQAPLTGQAELQTPPWVEAVEVARVTYRDHTYYPVYRFVDKETGATCYVLTNAGLSCLPGSTNAEALP